MKKKLLTLLFSLLLAVGWTNTLQAQLKSYSSPAAQWRVPSLTREHATKIPQSLIKGKGVLKNAPTRGTNDVYANTVFTKAQYSAINYTWYEGPTTSYPSHTASLTDTVTNPNQMYWLFRSTYLNRNIPGIRWNDVVPSATVYYGVGHGWDVGTPIKTDVNIYIENNYGRLFSINVYNFNGDRLYTWSASSNNVLTGWSYSGTRVRDTYNGTYYWRFTNGGIITIPASQVPDEGCTVTINIMGQSNTNTCEYIIFNERADESGYVTLEGYTADATRVNFTADVWSDRTTVTMPDANGYSIFLLKLKDFPEVEYDEDNPDPYFTEWNKRGVQYSAQNLINVFDEYFASAELLTDGLRVGENTQTSGTVYAYQGVLNRFYLIGKGKTATLSTKYNFAPSGPFYDMYEEFSPTTQATGDETGDLYQNMWSEGEYYAVKHDCQSVLAMQHYYSMYGKDTTVYKSVSPIVFYIPDLRSQVDDRDYEIGHQPQVGLYRIFLTAEAEPSTTYAQDSTYTVTLDWTSTLNNMVNNDVPQTFIIYTVTTNDQGQPIYTPLDTVVNPTDLVYTYDIPQTLASQQIRYVILGFPIYDNDHPDVIVNDYFFCYSNPDDIQIPGLFDFMVLYRERYESDFVIHEENNYYRNYLYPTNIARNTGMTMGQLKQEWPNQTASYTLWRDNLGVAKLEVKAIGKKVYYRIHYYEDTQVTTGPNDIEMPYNYVEIPNENN